MKFSLIVVTTNRLRLAERLLTSLSAQTHKNFEVIFVHGKECATEAQALAATYAPGLDIRTLASTDHCLSRSRNSTLPLIRGDIIAFPDDDCVYETDTLAQCATVFMENQRVHVLMGRVCDLYETIAIPSLSVVQKLNYMSIFRHSFSIAQFHKRECIQAVGDFDEDMGVGCATPFQSGEDTDYALRALKSGFCLAYAPSILVRHPAVNVRDPALPEKVKAYAGGRMRLLRKHNMPAWFITANVVWPLARIPVECLKEFLAIFRYRWTMFAARLNGLLYMREIKTVPVVKDREITLTK
jgi:GT2 family glycosyltransferase